MVLGEEAKDHRPLPPPPNPLSQSLTYFFQKHGSRPLKFFQIGLKNSKKTNKPRGYPLPPLKSPRYGALMRSFFSPPFNGPSVPSFALD